MRLTREVPSCLFFFTCIYLISVILQGEKNCMVSHSENIDKDRTWTQDVGSHIIQKNVTPGHAHSLIRIPSHTLQGKHFPHLYGGATPLHLYPTTCEFCLWSNYLHCTISKQIIWIVPNKSSQQHLWTLWWELQWPPIFTTTFDELLWTNTKPFSRAQLG